MKSKGLLILLAILGILFFVGCNSYNGLVGNEEVVKKSWGNVESQYQRRYDLIDNLVNTVKGEANFEKGTLEAVINARASATKVTLDPTNLTPEKLAEFQNAQGGLNQALGRLMVVSEQYPNLKTNQSFLNLQTQIEGTENRINKARDDYNGTVEPYNVSVRKFPKNLFASMFGFKMRDYYKSDVEAKKAPKVDFGTGTTPTAPAK